MSFFKTDKGIFYLHPYYSTRYVEHSGVSDSIIAFKQVYQIPIDRFAKEMKEALLECVGNDISKLKENFLVVMPSHSMGKWSNCNKRVNFKL